MNQRYNCRASSEIIIPVAFCRYPLRANFGAGLPLRPAPCVVRLARLSFAPSEPSAPVAGRAGAPFVARPCGFIFFVRAGVGLRLRRVSASLGLGASWFSCVPCCGASVFPLRSGRRAAPPWVGIIPRLALHGIALVYNTHDHPGQPQLLTISRPKHIE